MVFVVKIVQKMFVCLVVLIGSYSTVRATVVDLEWATKSETNNDFFSIQRSTDCILWEIVGSVLGSGTTSEEHRYKYTDYESPDGKVYYSLQQTDVDGKSVVSKIISVTTSEDISTPTVVIYPNPSFSYLVLKSSENVFVTGMYSSNNCMVSNYSIAYDIIIVKELPEGIYFIQYQTAQGAVKTIPFMKN
jgi:hypothetical protein